MAEREYLETIITAAVEVFSDPEKMKLLTGKFLIGFMEDDLPVIVASTTKWARVRVDQSYSRQKASVR